MTKVSVVMVVYNSIKFLPEVCAGIMSQTVKDLEVLVVINSSTDGSLEYIKNNFPQFKLINPGTNTGFAGGNNLAIAQAQSEFIQLVNPDLIMTPNYIEQLVRVFDNPKIAAVTGKLLRYDFANHQKTNIIDSTGVVMQANGRGFDRGQLQIDNGQFNMSGQVFGVSGAGCMYRKSALQAIAYNGEFFDQDFVAYWEDVDLSWRLNNAGFMNWYEPQAIAYHGRTAGQSQGGYLKIWNFIKHHRNMPLHIRQLNYKNHILMYLKNTKSIHPSFILREIFMFVYILFFEPRTLGVVSKLLSSLKSNRLKRAQQHLH